MLQIVVSLIDAARGVIYDRHMFIVQATVFQAIVLVIASHFNHICALGLETTLRLVSDKGSQIG
jgi:hypothetical protein